MKWSGNVHFRWERISNASRSPNAQIHVISRGLISLPKLHLYVFLRQCTNFLFEWLHFFGNLSNFSICYKFVSLADSYCAVCSSPILATTIQVSQECYTEHGRSIRSNKTVDFIKLSQKYNQHEKTQSTYSFDILTHTRMKNDQWAHPWIDWHTT